MKDAGAGYAVRVRGVRKAFGRTPALRGVDLDVPWGSVLSLVGSNGSGKTTLIKILATLTKADDGQALVCGLNAGRWGAEIRRRIGVVMHDSLLYDDLTGRENLAFFCRMFSLDGADERVERATATMGVSDRLDQRIGAMSHGLKKRFSIARALLHEPDVLLMDEPDSGLDQDALALLDGVIRDAAGAGGAAIVTTHNRERAARLGDSIAVLSDGRLSYAGAADGVEAEGGA